MSSIMRSEEMVKAQIYVQAEAAYSIMSELGELGITEFIDLNPHVNAFQRRFITDIRRCNTMEWKLNYLMEHLKLDGIVPNELIETPRAPYQNDIVELEASIEKLEQEMQHINQNSDALNKNYLELIEYKHLVQQTEYFFKEAMLDTPIFDQNEDVTPTVVDHNLNVQDVQINVGAATDGYHLNFGFVSGIISNESMLAFEKMIWRVSFGNVYVKKKVLDHTIEDPKTRTEIQKVCFILFFQGEELKKRIKKVCNGFQATLYPCPETRKGRRDLISELTSRIEELYMILDETQTHRRRISTTAAKHINEWYIHVLKIKYIYHTLNMCNFDVSKNCLLAQCWCPSDDFETVSMTVRRGTERSAASITSIVIRAPTQDNPPTFNKSNKYIKVYQSIVDAYGVASYREVNPAVFSIITFPFLFAVMFGDMGHGLIMTIFAVLMLYYERTIEKMKKKDEILEILFGGRYIILLMGLFSMYTGFIYNDVFSKSMNIFGSSWSLANVTLKDTETAVSLDPLLHFKNVTYVAGMDPIWQIATNKLTFVNSYKMKMSIIIGFIHMTCGIILGIFNHLHFDKTIDIVCMWIPQMIFILSLFGYLNILIFYKWIYITAASTYQPSLLVEFINMMLFSYPPGSANIYTFQKGVQTLLVVIAILCIPWMLFSKITILYMQKRGTVGQGFLKTNVGDGVRTRPRRSELPGSSTQELLSEDIDTSEHFEKNDDETKTQQINNNEEDETDLVEGFIYQGIHVIEYCLGVISNMASYLRLWALSLAHSQLSEVLWQRGLSIGFQTEGVTGIVVLIILFLFWAILTIGILIVMEGLSAFLHALRLHWVEFQNKFYGGKGYPFVPFSFETIVSEYM